MKKKILIIIVTAALGVVATWLGRIPVENWFSSRMRNQSNIPEIMNSKWSAEWRFEDGSLYAADTITLVKWTRNNRFEGYGEVTYDNEGYQYPISGEVSRTGIVILTYHAERYPTEANIGTACLQLSINAKDLSGGWVGLVSRKQADGKDLAALHVGNVKMHKIR